jgi:hypothetical protein
MAEVKTSRTKKKQLGQFMTPPAKCEEILSEYKFKVTDKVLEPSFGCGNFIVVLIDKFLPLYDGDISHRIEKILANNIYGVEVDPVQFDLCLEKIKGKFGFVPENHNLSLCDYFLYENQIEFDYIIGNPPFGGTIDPVYQVEMDKKYGVRNSYKIKKETYSFFMVKSIENLKENGTLIFISSDTFLTIKTMTGLRRFLFESGSNVLDKLNGFSEETDYPMVVLTHQKSNKADHIVLDGMEIPHSSMLLTGNFSWYIQDEYTEYFRGPNLSEFILGSGGMTVGKNEFFLREISPDNTIQEKYTFEFFEDPITLEKELARARNNTLSPSKIKDIEASERLGQTKRDVRITEREVPITIQLPHPDYKFYNKSSGEILYSTPKNVIFWKDGGDACYTFKRNGNWYLGGVGGKQFFERECLTWQLISSSIKARYLPEGNILDNSSPVIVLRGGIDKGEIFFILGWLLTTKCNEILKKVINHTMNIQSKDIERLPYPFWVSPEDKASAIEFIESKLRNRMAGISEDVTEDLDKLFAKK